MFMCYRPVARSQYISPPSLGLMVLYPEFPDGLASSI